MAFFRKEVHCPACDYRGHAVIGWLNLSLWILAAVFLLFSFIFWPLFLVWPVLLYLLLLFPMGQTCPACKSRSVKVERGTDTSR